VDCAGKTQRRRRFSSSFRAKPKAFGVATAVHIDFLWWSGGSVVCQPRFHERSHFLGEARMAE